MMSLLFKLSPLSRNINSELIKNASNCWLRSNELNQSKINFFKGVIFNSKSTRSSIHICSNASTTDALSLRIQQPILVFTRNGSTSFFNKLTAQQLWKGVTSVSNAGRKRGRGKGNRKIMSKNLNRGQFIGTGEENMVWPGLNAPVLRGKEIVRQKQLPRDEDRLKALIEMRDKMGVFRPLRLNPLERGWCGNRMPGRSIGPPDPIGEDHFKGFDTKVLESKTVTKMDGNLGRKRRISMFVVTGNKNGVAGFALAKANNIANVSRKCSNLAGQRLMYIERCDGHTVYHDFFCEFMSTRIFVKRKPEGYGLVCHRGIKEICTVLGIKNLHAKIEGSTNIQSVTKAFFLGLLSQRTHEQLAQEKSLYVAKIRPGTCPQVVAAPTDASVRSRDNIGMDEEMDFKLYTMDGRVEIEPKKFKPFYENLPSWENHLKRMVKSRNHEKIKKQLTLEYGEVASFLTEEHPECRPGFKIEEEEEG